MAIPHGWDRSRLPMTTQKSAPRFYSKARGALRSPSFHRLVVGSLTFDGKCLKEMNSFRKDVKPDQPVPDSSVSLDPQTAAQVKSARSRSNSWFSQVKQREARLQAAEDKTLEKEDAKRDVKEGKKSSFFGSALRRLSSTSRKDRRDSVSTVNSVQTSSSDTTSLPQNPRMTLNKNVSLIR